LNDTLKRGKGMKAIFLNQWFGLTVVAVAAGALSALFYDNHPVYVATFGLAGLVAGGYIVLMARLFGVRLGLKAVLVCWAVVLAATSSGEAYLRLHRGAQEDASPGMLPTIVAKFERWRTSDVAQPWLSSDYGVHIQDPSTSQSMTKILSDQFCRSWSFNTLMRYDNIFMISVPGRLQDILSTQQNEQQLRNAKDGWLLKQKVAENELQNLRMATLAGQEVLSRSQDPNRAVLLHQFLDAQRKMLSAYQARNDSWMPELQVAQAMMEELLNVKTSGRVTESDRVLWDSLMQKNEAYEAKSRGNPALDPNSVTPQYRSQLKLLFGLRPDDPRIIPEPNDTCISPMNLPSHIDAITPQLLIDDADRIINQ
jgi:hypothetical protein